MSEIKKLYENAGVEKKWKPLPYGDIEEFYPPFTAEKQLELIKWLIQKNFYDERIIRSNYEKTSFYCSYLDDYCESEEFEKFEEALANVFNYFWQDLTDTEKEQIKEILNG